MRRRFQRPSATVLAGLMMAVLASVPARGQAKTSGFGTGYTDLGPAIGLGGIGNASASFGGRFEHAIKPLPDLGNGFLGVEASFDYYSWSDRFFTEKYIPLSVTANYHFKLDDPRWDPFIGAGLGYRILSCDYAGGGSDLCPDGGIYFVGRAGGRYFFSPKMAAYADVGAGAATFNVGLMFRMH